MLGAVVAVRALEPGRLAALVLAVVVQVALAAEDAAAVGAREPRGLVHRLLQALVEVFVVRRPALEDGTDSSVCKREIVLVRWSCFSVGVLLALASLYLHPLFFERNIRFGLILLESRV